MVAIICLILNLICLGSTPAVIAPSPVISEDVIDVTWDDFHTDAYNEYADEFTALFSSYETKRASNGVLLIRSGSSGSYRFAKRSI
jgi:hypothetical protein